MTDSLTVERRATLLARSSPEEVVALAEEVVAVAGMPTVLVGPDVGMVMMQVREPVAAERFHLGEVVVTAAEVDLAGARGWSMRLGRDRVATLAAAVCDAAAELHVLVDEIERMCRRTEALLANADREEWARLAPTAVSFEVLD